MPFNFETNPINIPSYRAHSRTNELRGISNDGKDLLLDVRLQERVEVGKVALDALSQKQATSLSQVFGFLLAEGQDVGQIVWELLVLLKLFNFLLETK